MSAQRLKDLSDEEKRERLIDEIKTFRDHPALLAWYIADEPTGNKISPETVGRDLSGQSKRMIRGILFQ